MLAAFSLMNAGITASHNFTNGKNMQATDFQQSAS